MKGNETRVVIFLQPVNPSNEGQVSTLKQSKWMFSPFLLLLVLGTLLGLGMLGFVLFTIERNGNLSPESTTVSTIVGPTTVSAEPTAYIRPTLGYARLKTTTDITTPAATTISSRHSFSVKKKISFWANNFP